jgi:hypothetical protein
LQRFPDKRANASEPERTPNLAILATQVGPEAGLGEHLSDRSACSRRAGETSIDRRPVCTPSTNLISDAFSRLSSFSKPAKLDYRVLTDSL